MCDPPFADLSSNEPASVSTPTEIFGIDGSRIESVSSNSNSEDSDSDPNVIDYGLVSVVDPERPVWIRRPVYRSPPIMSSTSTPVPSLLSGLSRPTLRPNHEVQYVTWEVIERLFKGIESLSRDLKLLKRNQEQINANIQTLNWFLLEVTRVFQRFFKFLLHSPKKT
jgi:hypothetical protein